MQESHICTCHSCVCRNLVPVIPAEVPESEKRSPSPFLFSFLHMSFLRMQESRTNSRC